MAAAARALTTDDDIARLIQRLLPLEADAALRSHVMHAKCEQLTRVLAYVDRASAARASAQHNAQRRLEAAHAETRGLEGSIGDAVRRARRIRLQLASASPSFENNDDDSDKGDDDGKTDGNDDDPGELRGILAQARAIRLTDDRKSALAATSLHQGREPREAPLPSPPQSSPPPPTRVEYPRRLKTLLEQLDDYAANERTQPFRAAFCRKMTEHLAVGESGGGGNEVQEARVQVGYARQVERLRIAYRRMGDYLEAKASPHAEPVQKALRTPSISSVYPVYCRLTMVLVSCDPRAPSLILS